jgi:hypothetical protein
MGALLLFYGRHCTPYDLNTHTDSNCRKQHTRSLEVYGAFGVTVKRRESVGESLDAEFCQRGESRRLESCEKEELSDQPENSVFPSNKLDTYQIDYCGSFGTTLKGREWV